MDNNIKEKRDYNSEPVYYCKHCLSLKVVDVEGIDCCDECGSTDIEESTIEHWDALYKLKYGKDFLKNKSVNNYNYGRRSKNSRKAGKAIL